MKRFLLMAVVVCMASQGATAVGGIKSAPIREAAEYVLEKFSTEVAEDTVETLSAKIAKYAAKYGDEAVSAIRKVGPRAFTLVDEAGENAPAVLRLLNRYGNAAVWVASKPKSLAIFEKYGDDAAAAMIKHPSIAEPMLDEFGVPGAKALETISGQEARRLAIMQSDKTLTALGKADQLLDVVSRYGDAAADWMWRNKGALASAAVVSAFVANPKPFLDGAVEIVGKGVDATIRPAADQITRSMNWNLIAIVALLVAVTMLAIRRGWYRMLLRRPEKNVPA